MVVNPAYRTLDGQARKKMVYSIVKSPSSVP
jgi:hypothetical protein